MFDIDNLELYYILISTKESKINSHVPLKQKINY